MQRKHPLQILIVEDNLIIATDLSIHLHSLGFQVIGIHTKAEDALLTLKTQMPDIILMDIFLKGKMTGIELAIDIKNTSGIPVIFISANTTRSIFRHALKAKPYAFIPKPFIKKDLKKAIQLTLNRMITEQGISDYRSDINSYRSDIIVSRSDVDKAIHRS